MNDRLLRAYTWALAAVLLVFWIALILGVPGWYTPPWQEVTPEPPIQLTILPTKIPVGNTPTTYVFSTPETIARRVPSATPTSTNTAQPTTTPVPTVNATPTQTKSPVQRG